MVWLAISVLGLSICGLTVLFYLQVQVVNKLKIEVKKLIGKRPKKWDKEVKNVWSLDDE